MAVSSHTVVCGLEPISLQVARALVQLGEDVTIVAEAPEPALVRAARRAGARVIAGAWSDVAHLRSAGLADARCIVLTENADLRNVQVALAARAVNPHVRVVLRMFNAELADRATRLLANSRVVSTSAEAAPYFAATALGPAAAPASLAWGRRIEVRDAGPGAAGGPVEPVHLGEGESLHVLEPPVLPSRRHWRRVAVYRRALLALLDPRLAVLGTAVALLLAISTAVFHSAGGLKAGSGQATGASWLDALVFAVTTAFGNTDVTQAAWWVKLYVVVYMFTAALGLAMTFGLVADVVIGLHLQEALGEPRGRMRNHVVVLGLGNLGYRTTIQLLEAGVEVAACESRSAGRFVAIARRLGVPVLIADATFLDSLRALSVERARAVIAATSDDLANLEATLAARELNPSARVIARLFDQDLAERAQEQLHITECRSVEELATPAFAAAALGNGVLSLVERRHRLWVLAEVTVRPGCEAEGATLEALEREVDLRVLAVREGSVIRWRPASSELVRAGREVLVACSREAWEQLRARVVEPAAVNV